MPTEHEDRALILAAQADTAAFAALYEKYVDKLYQFLYYRTGHSHDIAEELVAELFVRALKQLPNFEWQGYPYSAYLYRIARSLCVEYYGDARVIDDITDVEVRDPYSESTVTATELKLLWEHIQTFPQATQEMLELRYLEDLPYEDIAEIVGKKSGAVRTAISRAIDTLQERYATH